MKYFDENYLNINKILKTTNNVLLSSITGSYTNINNDYDITNINTDIELINFLKNLSFDHFLLAPIYLWKHITAMDHNKRIKSSIHMKVYIVVFVVLLMKIHHQ